MYQVLRRVICMQLVICLLASSLLACFAVRPKQAHAVVPVVAAAVAALGEFAADGAVLATLASLCGFAVLSSSTAADDSAAGACASVAKQMGQGLYSFSKANADMVSFAFETAITEAGYAVEAVAMNYEAAIEALSSLVKQSAQTGSIDCNALTGETMLAFSAYLNYLGINHASSMTSSVPYYTGLFDEHTAKIVCGENSQTFTGNMGTFTLFEEYEIPLALPYFVKSCSISNVSSYTQQFKMALFGDLAGTAIDAAGYATSALAISDEYVYLRQCPFSFQKFAPVAYLMATPEYDEEEDYDYFSYSYQLFDSAYLSHLKYPGDGYDVYGGSRYFSIPLDALMTLYGSISLENCMDYLGSHYVEPVYNLVNISASSVLNVVFNAQSQFGVTDSLNKELSGWGALNDSPVVKPPKMRRFSDTSNAATIGADAIIGAGATTAAGTLVNRGSISVPWSDVATPPSYPPDLHEAELGLGIGAALGLTGAGILTGVNAINKDTSKTGTELLNPAIPDTAIGTLSNAATGELELDIPLNQMPIVIPAAVPVALSFADAASPFLQKFPFCIPGNIHSVFSAMAQSPAAPSFTWDFYVMGQHHYFDVDLAPFNSVAAVMRMMVFLSLLFSSIFLAMKLINMLRSAAN